MGISLNQLTNTISQVKTYCVNKFAHDNIDVLDKLSEDDNGKINYNNSPIQDSYSKEEFNEILKSDYKQIFDKDSNVELLDKPVSFTANGAKTTGTAVATSINQNFSLNQSIEDFDYLLITCETSYNSNIVNRFHPVIFIPVKQIIYNSSETIVGNDKSCLLGYLNIGTTNAGAFGEWTYSFAFWFKDTTNAFIYNANNPHGYAVTITIASIVGTKFNSTEIYKETSVLSIPTNYSLEEKCIGSWINGKPLYEKVINNQTITFARNSSDYSYKTVIECNVSLIDAFLNCYIIRHGVEELTDTFIPCAIQRKSSNEVTLFSNTNFTNCNYIVIRYTKTTDEENSFTPDMLSTDEIDDTITDEDIENLMTQIKEG